MGFTKYIKTAFTNKWNMLAFCGGLGFAAISGRPDVAMPIVLAAELGYLGMLGTHPKFQSYVNAQEHKASKNAEAEDSDRVYRKLFGGLGKRGRKRFSDLRVRCMQLRAIADNLNSADADRIEGLEDVKESGLDQLLWIFLKLLFTEQTLENFFKRTDVGMIERDIKNIEKRIAKEQTGKARDRMLETLRDNLATSRLRLENYEKARENHELVELELERLENKIHSLSELGVNQRDPDYITSQVDGVAKTMLRAHETINELEFITGVHSDQSEEVPDIIRRKQKVAS